MIKKRILVIADDMSVYCSVRACMENDSTDVCCINDPARILEIFIKQEYCLIIADFPLLKMDGLKVIRTMKGIRRTPILVITFPLKTDEKVALFQAVANACLGKPADEVVCAAQSTSLIGLYLDSERKSFKYHPLVFGQELVINPLYRQVIIDGIQLELTRTEFDLLLCLAQHPGQVWSRSQLYQHVWKDTLGSRGDNTVRTHIGNLRKKLTSAGKGYIQTERGIGYKFIFPQSL